MILNIAYKAYDRDLNLYYSHTLTQSPNYYELVSSKNKNIDIYVDVKV